MRDLTQQENEVLELTKDVANKCITLPELISDDGQDVYYHLRAIQNIIYARPAFELQNKPVKL